MIARLLAKILGTNNTRQLRRIQPLVNKINYFEPHVSTLTDAQLALKTNEFREQLAQGRSLDDLLPEAFAVIREAGKRTLGQRHYDVQLIGGIALHNGSIAEMKTGEGKTLTATLPLYVHALLGKGAHLVTVNDYLARRDAEWMSPIYNFLGLSVGILQNNMDDAARKQAYNSDILYATNNELGFDYLRDNMKFRLEDYVQRDLQYAIVDEVDSILIDEARTPLIISGAAQESSELYSKADVVVRRLQKDEDYQIDEKERAVHLTESGIDKIEQAFHIKNLYAVEHLTLLHHVTQALRAHAIFRRDVDYVVHDDQVLIVDEFTGRILQGRRYSDGLHQALEAKEGVDIERETQTLATITLQNYFRMYRTLAGMTGTAATEAEEFYRIYKLGVVSVPTNKPMIRTDKSDLIFLTRRAKFNSIVEDVKERYVRKQPVLIGTVAIETSELLSHVLTLNGVPHDVLNAKNHAREAEIVEHAGEPGRITIATNMAGRGTDIKLTPESKLCGGLYILGTERHESRRIDNQLRGRSGRQGDPGESRFYISLEDDLIRRFGGESMKRLMERFGMKEDEVIESGLVSKNIERAQEKVEKHNFEIRRYTLEYDDVLNQQRKVVYGYRRSVLEGAEQISELVRDLVNSAMQDVLMRFCPQRIITSAQIHEVLEFTAQMTSLSIELLEQQNFNKTDREQLQNDISNYLLEQYDLYRNQQKTEIMQQAEKWLMLEVIDTAWKQHMLNLDHLREGIGLRSWGQKNPLLEYKREAFAMFQEMMSTIKLDIIHHIFHLNVERFDQQALEARRQKELEQLNFSASVDTTDETTRKPTEADQERTGRNDPCPCGSGKKYKKCHGAE